MNYAKFAHFTQTPKVPTNKTNVKNCILWKFFSKTIAILQVHGLPSKVAHTKYAVAETRIPV